MIFISWLQNRPNEVCDNHAKTLVYHQHRSQAFSPLPPPSPSPCCWGDKAGKGETEPGNWCIIRSRLTKSRKELWVSLVITWLILINCRARGIVGEWYNFLKSKEILWSRSTHCDQFFGWRRLNCHSIIKIFLCCPHFDRHGKTLQHLVTAYAKNVQSNNLSRNDEKQSENSVTFNLVWVILAANRII